MEKDFYRVVRSEAVELRLYSVAPTGRFHDTSSPGPTSYACQTLESAWAEVRKYLSEADPGAFTVLVLECQVSRTVDLTDAEVRLEWGITKDELVSRDHSACQRLAQRLRKKKIPVVRTYSAADPPDGRTIVVFSECLKHKSQFRIKGRVPLVKLLPSALL